MGNGMSSKGSRDRTLSYVRVMRMVRTVRLLRIVRVMRFFTSLRVLVYSVLATLRSLFWTMLLLALLLYTFGLLFTQAASEHLISSAADGTSAVPGLKENFGTLPRSVFALFKCVTGGVSWQEVVQPLSEVGPSWVMFFLVFVSFTYFAVLNVVTGVFCQTAIESAQHSHDVKVQSLMSDKQEYILQLETLFEQTIMNENGFVTLREFEEVMKDERVKAYFASMDISVDEAFNLFKLLDTDGSHIIDLDAFVTGCLRLRGTAKSMDIAMLMYETRWTMRRFLNLQRSLEEQFRNFCALIAGEDGNASCSGSVWNGPPPDEERLSVLTSFTEVHSKRKMMRSRTDMDFVPF